MSSQAPSSKQATSIADGYKLLNITRNPDGSITRPTITAVPPSPTPSQNSISLSKDVPLNPTFNTSIRLFLPHPLPSDNKKLPLILYFHGGGFILLHPSSYMFHNFSSAMASQLSVIIASVDYRLAPEYPLPAAYDDAVESMDWIKKQAMLSSSEVCVPHEDLAEAEPWLKNHADFSNCYIMGSSAGGNIAYFAALRATDMDLSPVKIRGLILNSPFFGGVQRTESETRLADNLTLPLPASDLMWAMALPGGADRDHEFCNPTVGDRVYGEKIGRLPRCLLNAYGGDPLVDRQKEVVKILEGRGVKVWAYFVDGGYHAVDTYDEPEKAFALGEQIHEFIYNSN